MDYYEDEIEKESKSVAVERGGGSCCRCRRSPSFPRRPSGDACQLQMYHLTGTLQL